MSPAEIEVASLSKEVVMLREHAEMYRVTVAALRERARYERKVFWCGYTGMVALWMLSLAFAS